jgi:hypothetical protein
LTYGLLLIIGDVDVVVEAFCFDMVFVFAYQPSLASFNTLVGKKDFFAYD